MTKTVYQVTLQVTRKERPTSKSLEINGKWGKIIAIKKQLSDYVIDVEFQADSVMQLMLDTDPTIVSSSVH